MNVFPLSVVWSTRVLPSELNRKPSGFFCFFLLSIGCGGKTGWSCGPEQLRSFNLDARKCFPATFTRTLPPLAARLSSQILSRLLLRSSRIKTVMFGRGKKRRDDAGGEVGRCPKVWRLHGARGEAFGSQRRAFDCFKKFLLLLLLQFNKFIKRLVKSSL